MIDAIEAWLARAGPSKSVEVAKALGLSASTVRRWVARQGDRVLKTGSARASRIALRRPIDGLRTPLVVFDISRDGIHEPSFTLHPVQPF